MGSLFFCFLREFFDLWGMQDLLAVACERQEEAPGYSLLIFQSSVVNCIYQALSLRKLKCHIFKTYIVESNMSYALKHCGLTSIDKHYMT